MVKVYGASRRTLWVTDSRRAWVPNRARFDLGLRWHP